MIYLQWCCFCVDLRVGTFIIGVSDFIMDLVFGILIALFGESGKQVILTVPYTIP